MQLYHELYLREHSHAQRAGQGGLHFGSLNHAQGQGSRLDGMSAVAG